MTYLSRVSFCLMNSFVLGSFQPPRVQKSIAFTKFKLWGGTTVSRAFNNRFLLHYLLVLTTLAVRITKCDGSVEDEFF